MINIFQISFICGGCMLLAAAVMLVFPPKKINMLYGYRSVASMKSQERWDFAQRYSTVQMVKAAVFMVAASFTGYFFPQSVLVNLIASGIITIGAVCYMFISTEKELKKRFSEIKK